MKISMPLFAAVLAAPSVFAGREVCDPPSGCSLDSILSGSCPDACQCPCYTAGGMKGFMVQTNFPGDMHDESLCMGASYGYELMKKGSVKCLDHCVLTREPPKVCGCPQYKPKVTDDDDEEIMDPKVPKPEKCVMKRKTELLMYEPNFPQSRPDVYIEVEIGTGERFQFYPDNYPEYANSKKGGVVPIEDKDVFKILFDEQEKLGGQGFKLRYVSKNGPGEWNSCKYSPIAFDLNGNGVVDHITDTSAGFMIDITGDGDQEHLSEWFAPTEGILIDTHNEEGLADFAQGIITGDHLMGDMAGQYTDGFAKLATYDENCDDQLTGAELDGLFIWVDSNSNLVLDEGELFSLAHFGIVAISTVHDDLVSHAVLSDGSTMMMQDLWFDAFEAERRLARNKRRMF